MSKRRPRRSRKKQPKTKPAQQALERQADRIPRGPTQAAFKIVASNNESMKPTIGAEYQANQTSEAAQTLCKPWIERAQPWIELGLLLAALAGVPLVLWQIYLTRNALSAATDANEIARRALNANIDANQTSIGALTAAIDANVIARESSQQQSRAYVDLVTDEGAELVYDKYAFGGAIQLKNCGQTPAYDVQVRSSMHYEPTELARLKFPADSLTLTEGQKTIGPGQIWRTFLYMKIDPVNNPDPATFANSVWVRGRVDYRDAFGKPHFSEFVLRQGAATSPGKFAFVIVESNSD